ncbi:MAG: mechanosensitive ion channel [Actinomycetota bacterium]|jgi:small-conductance mechanosensitive channel|nr:mechanosensitive ion channel [Rubrobacteraceae bacterium]MBA3702230.1 mechanosensitive ion channel [Rubrobacteraceae bacterium]MDQ3184243.1 mechanosensitive ion channel [Actinomycetota bacterium]MDQ3499038.1 mechanosensitive ion channel [Actinomycetota bacterium]
MPQPTHDLVSTLAEFVPRLVGAVVVLLVALVVALLLQRLMARFLEGLGLEDLFERTGAANSLWQLGYEGGPSRLIGTVLFWGIMLTGVAGSLSVLGLSSLESTMDQIVNLSGRALVALVILIAGVMSAGWLAELVAREAERAELRGANAFRRIVFMTIIGIAALLAAAQLGLETYVVVLLAVVVLATVGLVTALAMGQGLALLSGNIAAGRYVQDGTAVGDVISVDGVEGTVEELGYASVTVRSEDGNLYRIPNRTLLENVVRKRG